MPGLRPAPEMARYDRITAERTVQQAVIAAGEPLDQDDPGIIDQADQPC
jgi:hypothetical protein